MKVTVSRELLRQVLNAACSPYCAQDLGQLMPAIKAALEQPAPVQEPAAEILSDVIHRNAKKLVFTHHGLSLPVGTKLYTATQPAPVQEPEKLNPLTQLQVAYVMGLRDAQPRKAVKLAHQFQITECHPVLYGLDDDTLAFARAIESAVLKVNGVEK